MEPMDRFTQTLSTPKFNKNVNELLGLLHPDEKQFDLYKAGLAIAKVSLPNAVSALEYVHEMSENMRQSRIDYLRLQVSSSITRAFQSAQGDANNVETHFSNAAFATNVIGVFRPLLLEADFQSIKTTGDSARLLLTAVQVGKLDEQQAALNKINSNISQGFASVKTEQNAAKEELEALNAEERTARIEAALRNQGVVSSIGLLRAAAQLDPSSRGLAIAATVAEFAFTAKNVLSVAAECMSAGGLAMLHPVAAIGAGVLSIISVLKPRGPDPVLQGLKHIADLIHNLRLVVQRGFNELKEQIANLSLQITDLFKTIESQMAFLTDTLLPAMNTKIDLTLEKLDRALCGNFLTDLVNKACEIDRRRALVLSPEVKSAVTERELMNEIIQLQLDIKLASDAPAFSNAEVDLEDRRAMLNLAVRVCLAYGGRSAEAIVFAELLRKSMIVIGGIRRMTQLPPNDEQALPHTSDYSTTLRTMHNVLTSQADDMAAMADRFLTGSPQDRLHPSTLTEATGLDKPLVQPRAVWSVNVDSHNSRVEIGAGGSSHVYRGLMATTHVASASDRMSETTGSICIAGKVISLGSLTSDDAQSVYKEIGILSQLGSHPNIIKILAVTYDVNSRDSNVSFVMPLALGSLQGALLDAEFTHQTLPLNLKYAAIRAFRGLEHAHKKRVLHRDIKPANFLIMDNGLGQPVVQLADFGVATFTATTIMQRTRRTGASVGTLAWMAPEMFCSDAPHSTETDVVSFALVLFAILNSRLIHGGGLLPPTDMELMRYYIRNGCPKVLADLVHVDNRSPLLIKWLSEVLSFDVTTGLRGNCNPEHVMRYIDSYVTAPEVSPPPTYDTICGYCMPSAGVVPVVQGSLYARRELQATPPVPSSWIVGKAARNYILARSMQRDVRHVPKFDYDVRGDKLRIVANEVGKIIGFLDVVPSALPSLFQTLRSSAAALQQRINTIVETHKTAFSTRTNNALGLFDNVNNHRAPRYSYQLDACPHPRRRWGRKAHFYEKFFGGENMIVHNLLPSMLRDLASRAQDPIVALGITLGILVVDKGVVHFDVSIHCQRWGIRCCSSVPGVNLNLRFIGAHAHLGSRPLFQPNTDAGDVSEYVLRTHCIMDEGNRRFFECITVASAPHEAGQIVRSHAEAMQTAARQALQRELETQLAENVDNAVNQYVEVRNTLLLAAALGGLDDDDVKRLEEATSLDIVRGNLAQLSQTGVAAGGINFVAVENILGLENDRD